jgi:outer membrane beta-barrel protein
MPRPAIFVPLLLTSIAAISSAADAAEQQPAQPANEQVIVPQVDRRDIKVPHIRSNDIEFGVFAGTYNAENFGSSTVRGLRVGYHVTEDVFFESAYGQTKISDEAFRQILPSGIFPQPKEKLTYYNISVGYNLFPGEVFFGRNTAMVSSVYLIAGIGSTRFINSQLVDERHQTVNAGIGMRVLMADWAALQVDLRDHVFANDILGVRKTTQNFELSGGLTFFF